MKITTQQLRSALQSLLEDFEVHGASEWEIDKDFYWDIDQENRYDSYEKPTAITLGQLSDDVGEVLAIARGEKPPTPMGLVWISNILRLAGEMGPHAMVAKTRPE